MEIAAHRSVLREAAIEALGVRPGGCYVDGTFGRGGHAAAILERLGREGRLWLIDRDPAAIALARARYGDDPRCHICQISFARARERLLEAGLGGRIDGFLLDLGVSSPQLDDPARGFSFLREGPLDMRMDNTTGDTAAALLARASGRELARILREYGEERHAGRIARAVVVAREAGALPDTTTALAALVERVVPGREPGKHPATRTFQALRIAVNGELGELERFLGGVVELLAAGGRLVVISFHSLEDRLVKRFMRDRSRVGDLPPGVPVAPPELQPVLRLIGRRARPEAAEVAANPRARSAVMRVAERLP